MRTRDSRRGSSFTFVFTLVLLAAAAYVAAKPLSENDVKKLIELQIGDEVIVAKLDKEGAGFSADEKVVTRLKAAGASDAVIAAVEKNAKTQQATGDASYAAPAAAAPGATLDAAAGAAAAGAEVTDFVILLDCSGSMSEPTPDKQPKMDVAKKSVTDLVQRMPAGTKVMFVIYGHDKALECQAVKVVRPLSPLDDAGKSELTKTIAELKPVGGTPIALAIKTAGEELKKASNVGTAGLVLISDGKESCKGDPAAEAKALVEDPKLKGGVTVIGFGVAGDERASLEAIASAGKGKYYDAKDAASLEVAVKKVEPAGGKRRAIRVLKPAAADFELPAMARMGLVAAEGYGPDSTAYRPLAEVKGYDMDLRLPSAEKFDVWWIPAQGRPVRMIAGMSIADRKRVEVKPEEHLGIVQVKGDGLPAPKVVALVEPEGYGPDTAGAFRPVQTCTKYGELMVVPAGKYDLWLKADDGGAVAEVLEKKLEVPAGKVTVIE
jgi:Mg-chelatase subunit ChlD